MKEVLDHIRLNKSLKCSLILILQLVDTKMKVKGKQNYGKAKVHGCIENLNKTVKLYLCKIHEFSF